MKSTTTKVCVSGRPCMNDMCSHHLVQNGGRDEVERNLNYQLVDMSYKCVDYVSEEEFFGYNNVMER